MIWVDAEYIYLMKHKSELLKGLNFYYDPQHLPPTSYFDSAVLLVKRPGPTLHDRVHDTGSTDVICTQVAGGCLFLQL